MTLGRTILEHGRMGALPAELQRFAMRFLPYSAEHNCLLSGFSLHQESDGEPITDQPVIRYLFDILLVAPDSRHEPPPSP